MEALYQEINEKLVAVFDDILWLEEKIIKAQGFGDLSLKEIHTLVAIGVKNSQTTSQIAKKLGITAGTLTVAINTLVKKGYVMREKQAEDKRVVQLILSAKGEAVCQVHQAFHQDMVSRAVGDMADQEREVLMKGLDNLLAFLQEKQETLPVDKA